MKFGPTFPVQTEDFWGIKNLSKPKVLLAMATLSAFGNVLGFLMIPVGPQAKIDLTTLPLLIATCLYGPVPGFICGLLGSLVTIPQFGHPFSPLLWYDFYILFCGLLVKKIRITFAPIIAFVILWPTLGYWMNVIFLGFPVAIWWVIAAKEVIMALVYGFLIERLLSSERVRKLFMP